MAKVRIYTHTGMVSAPIVAGGTMRPTTDSMFLLKLPYIGGEVLEVTGKKPATSKPETAGRKTSVIFVQLPENTWVHYEVTPEGQPAREVSDASPILKEDRILDFSPGATISFMAATK